MAYLYPSRENLYESEESSGCAPIFNRNHHTLYIGICIMVVCTVIYGLCLGYVFKNRTKIPVQTRSPNMIMLSGVALYLDSMLNIGIEMIPKEHPWAQCFMGIFTTMFNHYIAWGILFLRAFRIRKLFQYYERTLENLNKSNQAPLNSLNPPTNIGDQLHEEGAEKKYDSKIKKISEKNLIYQLFLKFIIPITLLGVLSFVSPYVYAFIPVYEAEQCWEYFNAREFYQFSCTSSASKALQSINICSFIFFNWLELMILVYFLQHLLFDGGLRYQIRNIKDELNIKYELAIIIVLWTLFSIVYFILQQVNLNSVQDGKDLNCPIVETILTLILLRNLQSILVSCIFIWKTLQRKEFYQEPDPYYAFNDFDYVINSVTTHSKFDEFLKNSPEGEPYLHFWYIFESIRIIEMIKKEEEDILKQYELIEPWKKSINYYYRKNPQKFNDCILRLNHLDPEAEEKENEEQKTISGQSVFGNVDIDQLSLACYIELKKAYEEKFCQSEYFKDLINELRNDIIEFRLIVKAGDLPEKNTSDGLSY